MHNSLPTLEPAVPQFIGVNDLLYSDRNHPPSNRVAHLRLSTLIRQHGGVTKDIKRRGENSFRLIRLENIVNELHFLDQFLGGTKEVRTLLKVQTPNGKPNEPKIRLSEHSDPLRKMSACLKLDFVLPQALPESLSKSAERLFRKLASYNGCYASKTLAGLVGEIDAFFRELAVMGYEPNKTESEILTECHKLTGA